MIVNQKDKQKTAANVTATNSTDSPGTSQSTNGADLTQQQKSPQQAGKKSDVNKPLLKPGQNKVYEGYDLDSITPVSHNRGIPSLLYHQSLSIQLYFLISVIFF